MLPFHYISNHMFSRILAILIFRCAAPGIFRIKKIPIIISSCSANKKCNTVRALKFFKVRINIFISKVQSTEIPFVNYSQKRCR